MNRVLPVLLLIVSTAALRAEGQGRLVWQPVLDYEMRAPVGAMPLSTDAGGIHRINPFVSYTHVGTDFGFHGPAEGGIVWEHGHICLSLENGDQWAGMWHSLAGLAVEPREVLDFARCYPSLIREAMQPSVEQVMVTASGHGLLKLEVKSIRQETLWAHEFAVSSDLPRPLTALVPARELKEAKFLNWTAEPGSKLCLTDLKMGVRLPELSFDQYVLLSSYAKMARCYSPELGFLKDRAHIRSGDFNSIPATGIFALATAVMSQPDVGMVSPGDARQVLEKIWNSVAAIPTARGLLPHFVKFIDGKPVIHPGTEFSTIDTAIYYQSIFMAAQMLDDNGVTKSVQEALKRVDIAGLLLPDGAISHGMKDDGRTMLRFGWRDWGGETALVMLMAKLAGAASVPAVMQSSGHPWQGTGFIAEVQSLFYPDFDSAVPDAVSKVNWKEARHHLLAEQKGYFPGKMPAGMAAQFGLYGLSAAEGAYGTTYEVEGVDLDAQKLVDPHYILMSGALEENPQAVYALLHHMEKAGYLTPWGMVENIRADGTGYLPMISALNAGFETLGAYHLLAKTHHQEDAIYKISHQSTEMRLAVQMFYPGEVAKKETAVVTGAGS